MKVLVLGSKGQLGSCLSDQFDKTNYSIVKTSRNELDIADLADTKRKIIDISPNVVINATAYTAVDGDQLLIDTSGSGIGSAVTITLPASPSVGSEVTFIDSGNNFASNNLTIARNGSNILGAASNLVVSVNASAFTLVFVNATRGWAYKDKI